MIKDKNMPLFKDVSVFLARKLKLDPDDVFNELVTGINGESYMMLHNLGIPLTRAEVSEDAEGVVIDWWDSMQR